MTVAELLSRISSRELTEWIAFYKLEPFGAFEDEYRMAVIASTVANTARDEKKKKQPFQTHEFMRSLFKDEAEIEAKTLFEKARQLLGGKKHGKS